MATSGKFSMNIELGNDAMQQPQELADALREVANKIAAIDPTDTNAGGKVLDDNGNEVGTWEYEAEHDEEEDDGQFQIPTPDCDCAACNLTKRLARKGIRFDKTGAMVKAEPTEL